MTNTPFIKLFRTPNSGYFYDVGKNEIIKIPDSVFDYLEAVLNGAGAHSSEEVEEIINELEELGYLSAKRPQAIRHPSSALAPTMLNRAIDKITLQLTQECNFRCKYCIYSEEENLKQRSHSNKIMSREIAMDAVRFYCEHAVDSPAFNIGFYGGEPLLQWELIRDIVEFAEKELNGKRLTFTITTNASLLTEEIATYFEIHNFSVLISLDGVKEVNDKNRRLAGGQPTYDIVMNNIRNIKNNHPKLFSNIRISSVIDPEIDTFWLGEYPGELSDLPVSNFTMGLVENTDHQICVSEKFRNAMENEYLIAYLNEFETCGLEVRKIAYKQIEAIETTWNQMKPAFGILDVMAPSGPCIPGKKRLFISVDGKFYPCEKVIEKDSYCIGSISDGFYLDVVDKMLNIGSITAAECKSCWAIRHCNLCVKQFDYLSENAAAEKLELCDAVKRATINNIRAIILLYEMNTFYGGIRGHE